MQTYTTKGDVRRCCGHKHRSIQTAVDCRNRDQNACVRQGGYSDRSVVAVRYVDEFGAIQTRPMNDAEYHTYDLARDA